MHIIIVTVKLQISLCILSVESQAPFLYYVWGRCRQSAPLSFDCLKKKVHLIQPQPQTDHTECSNRKPLDFEDSHPPSHRQYLDHEESTKSIWSNKSYGLDRIGLYMYQEKWYLKHVWMAKTRISLGTRYIPRFTRRFFVIYFFFT